MSGKNGHHRRGIIPPGVHGVSKVQILKAQGAFNQGAPFSVPSAGFDVLVKLAHVGATAVVMLEVPESEGDRFEMAQAAHLEALKLLNPDGNADRAVRNAAAMAETIATKLRAFSGLDDHLEADRCG